MSLIQRTTKQNSQLYFLIPFSIIPIYAFTRSPWNTRLALDQLHLILIQLLFILFLQQRLNSSPVQTPSKTASPTDQQAHHTLSQASQSGKKLEKIKKPSLDTTAGVAESLRALIENTNDWIHVFPTPAIKILQHRSINSLYAVQTEFEEDGVTMEQLVRSIRESKQWEWDKMCECGEDLGDGITWLRLKGFWPIKPKELIIRSGIFQLTPPESTTNNGQQLQQPIRILAASRSTTHPSKKSNLEIQFAGYLIEQIPSCSGFQVTQIVDLSGFGPLPTFVTKAILTKFIPSSLKKLITLAQQIQPLSTSQDQEGASPSWMPPLLEGSISSQSSSTSSLKQGSDDQESLRPMVYELKKSILDLQLQLQQQNQSTSHPPRPRRLDFILALSIRIFKLLSLLGASSFLIFYISSFFALKNYHFSTLLNRFLRKKKLVFTRDYRRTRSLGNSDEVILLVDLFSKLKD